MQHVDWVEDAYPLARLFHKSRPESNAIPSIVLVIGDGDEGCVVLGAALVHQKIIVAAADFRARIIAAGGGAGLVDRAAAFLGVEELADAAKVFVALTAHQVFVAVAFARELGARRSE